MNTVVNDLDVYRMAALDHVNDVRELIGMCPLDALLPGEVKNANECPIARSVMYRVEGFECSSYTTYGTTIYDYNGVTPIVELEMSEDAQEFQRCFDDGDFLDLIS